MNHQWWSQRDYDAMEVVHENVLSGKLLNPMAEGRSILFFLAMMPQCSKQHGFSVESPMEGPSDQVVSFLTLTSLVDGFRPKCSLLSPFGVLFVEIR